jgi:hypothetical protein
MIACFYVPANFWKICAHFFATLEFSKTARFHISLVNLQCYNDETSAAQVKLSKY